MKFVKFVLLTLMSITTLFELGRIVKNEWPEIEREAIKVSDYMDERYDEALDFINEKVVMVFNKD